jgi:hypothetical protein
MKKVFLTLAMIGALQISTGCGGASHSKAALPGAAEFLGNKHWDMGKAEYQVYNLALGWYDKARHSQDSYMITVKEPWDSKKNVKTSDKTMDMAVMKFSIFDVFHTGTYPYSFKADMFMDVNTGEVVKYAMGSHDGCGNHYFQYEKHGATGKFKWNSYWNDHGKVVVKKSVSEFDTFFDALPLYLRFRLKDASYSAKVVQPLIANHPIDIKDAKKDLANQEDFTARGVPAIVEIQVKNTPDQMMAGKKVIKTEVVHGSATDVFYFESEFPHNMVKMEGKAKKDLKLTKFFDYWVPANRGQEAGYLFK